ncbi:MULTISPECIES: tetratricopeptide repeat protein [unclassified Leucobacter]|uniref:tetratricopeptide repeat protein n=1 Tax=unclassified Leucobacter TaxID=2621730 RepID=UPI00165D74B5|nr:MULTISPECIES: tetratricopeptide repeat protein [unclassified Leucobacter]MBC9935638.1 tetratricopeptide repeat protein [Leucobacter sp. cx-87]
MSRRARAITMVAVMSALLVIYFGFALTRAFALFASGTPIAIAMGVALIVLPLIGGWALWRELAFGRGATRLMDRLESAGRLPEEEVDTLPSGRPVRGQADAAFPRYREAAEADPDSWEAWMRLGIVYDACGDRTRARAAIRRAISLERQPGGGPSTSD